MTKRGEGEPMSIDHEQLLCFWGKTPAFGAAVDRYHPALYHMLDVACVAEVLLQMGSPRLRDALLYAWRGCNAEALLEWLPLLIAIHDLGKISAAFQGQATQASTKAQRERLEAQGIQFPRHPATDLYHAEISASWIHTRLQQLEPGTETRLIWALRDAMGGHHGRFPQKSLRDLELQIRRSERCASPWAAWRDDAYLLLRQLFAPKVSLSSVGAPHNVRAATAALTGFIVWCDWMGSNELDFPAEPTLLLTDYIAVARRRAQDAVEHAHLAIQRSQPSYTSFRELFPQTTPRPLQSLIDMLTNDQLAGPILAIMEWPTGEGKTEAAIALSRRLGALLGIDEIFFALPTMATSNQMFLRLQEIYSRLYGDMGVVRLTHSQSLVVEEQLRHRIALAADADPADQEGASSTQAIEWFTGSKKAMLAPFGVGTVDQIELASLNVRHYALRLFGLARKVVVIDEVHAYDAYMNTILEAALRWLASLGTSVILLSATLPWDRHRALAQAYREGLGEVDPVELPELPYPSLALYRQHEAHYRSCAVFRGEQRFVMRSRVRADAATEARYLVECVRAGGAVARICNRVDEAQEIYRELCTLFAGQRVLIHARFPLIERQQHEQRVEEWVGKATERHAAMPIIIVGTQVLEQSLDYDVDLMISDFAPIDLLLQRAGRLHRHQRPNDQRRPAHYSQPVLEVCLPQGIDGLPNWQRWEAIYEPYILWKTWEALGGHRGETERTITLPQDYRPLIEAVYGASHPSASEPQVAALIEKAWERFQRHQHELQAQGRRPLIPDVTSPDPIIVNGGTAFYDEESHEIHAQLAKTRLGERISLVPIYTVHGGLALDSDGTWQLSLDIPPRLQDTTLVGIEQLLQHAIPVSDRALVAAYRAEHDLLRWPASWGELPVMLRSIFPLYLDEHHSAIIGDRKVTLDRELGLVIEKVN